MKPKGEDTAAAIREWTKDEIKNAPASRLELGKFFFGVSTASGGVLVAIKKLETPVSIDWTTGLALLFLFISILIAIFMVIPRIWPLRGDSDLFEEHRKQIQRIRQFVWTWFLAWLLGVGLGVYAVLRRAG